MTELPKTGELSLSARMPVAKTRLGDGRAQADSSWTLKPGEKRVEKPVEVAQPANVERDQHMADELAEYDVRNDRISSKLY